MISNEVVLDSFKDTYIVNDRGVFRDLYLDTLIKAGAHLCSALSNGRGCDYDNFIYYDKLPSSDIYVVKLTSIKPRELIRIGGGSLFSLSTYLDQNHPINCKCSASEPKETKMIKYEKVTDLTLNEIAKAMIDGEVFYSRGGGINFKWSGNRFIVSSERDSEGLGVNGDYYRKVELTPMEAAKKACLDNMVNGMTDGTDFSEFTCLDDLDGQFITMCRAIVNAYDGK